MVLHVHGSAFDPRSVTLAFKFRDAAKVVGGMVLGTRVGTTVQRGLQTTGILGPGVGTLIAEQQSNFAAVNTKLDALRRQSSDPEVQRSRSSRCRASELERHGQEAQRWRRG
jgi:hypothetical protein